MRILMITTQQQKDDMIADIKSDKLLWKNCLLDVENWIFHFFIIQSYFSVPKDVRLNLKHYLVMKISNKSELQSIAINHSANTDYKDFIKIYREYT